MCLSPCFCLCIFLSLGSFRDMPRHPTPPPERSQTPVRHTPVTFHSSFWRCTPRPLPRPLACQAALPAPLLHPFAHTSRMCALPNWKERACPVLPAPWLGVCQEAGQGCPWGLSLECVGTSPFALSLSQDSVLFLPLLEIWTLLLTPLFWCMDISLGILGKISLNYEKL